MPKPILFVLFLCLILNAVLAQSYTLPYSGSNTITTCGGVLYDDGGQYGNFSTGCNGYTIINPSVAGNKVSVQGTCSGNYCYEDMIYIYDGAGINGTLLWSGFIDDGIVPLCTSTSGPLTVYFSSPSSSWCGTGAGMALNISCCNSCGCGGPENLTATPAGSTMSLSWTAVPGVSNYIVEYGLEGFTPGTGVTVQSPTNTCVLNGVMMGGTYDFYVYIDCNHDGSNDGDGYSMVTACLNASQNCIDYTNLSDPSVTCTYGSFSNPYASTGVVNGRHTVMTDGIDPYSRGLLTCVPPCATSSVRLGNSSTGSQAESITYTYSVDTTQYNILLLKYAAVLQNPGHTASEQPRFRFQILNANGVEIDPICGSADFISNASLGWNSGTSSTLWKDWTNVGMDITPYHGQTIKIRLTTYDCDQSGHFGYAYFTLGCTQKRITVESCGDVAENTYTAPDGFSYRWYFANSPGTTVGTNQSVTVPVGGNQGTLFCDVSFIDNPTCKFTLSTEVRLRYPLAEFTYDKVLCTYTYNFTNNSTISSDGVTPDGTGDPCDQYFWDFGDGSISYEENPSHDFPGPGTYMVKLAASLGNGACGDTIMHVVVIPPFGPQIAGDSTMCDGETIVLSATEGNSFAWSNGSTSNAIAVSPHNTTTYSLRAFDADGCPDTLYHTVVVYPTYQVAVAGEICQGEDYYGYDFELSHVNRVGVNTYVRNLNTQHGCDSIVTLSLNVKEMPVVELGNDRTVCFEEDGGIYLYANDWYENYYWNTGDLTSFIQVTDTGYYFVEINHHGCKTFDDIHIAEVCPYKVFLPNTITPWLEDGKNDYFALPTTERVASLEIDIFDRWGKVVFHSTDPGFRWDGTVDGRLIPNTVFNYKLTIVSDDTKKHVFKGHITVL